MHKSQSLYNLIITLHVSGVTITHLQEDKTTVTTASGNRYTVLLSAAIVEELELFSSIVCCYRGKVGTGLSVLWVVYAIYSQQTNIHPPGGIRTQDLSRRHSDILFNTLF